MIAAADTFLATAFEGKKRLVLPRVDVSHRGGKPGFVRVDDAHTDNSRFVGNFHFNTFGNATKSPCGSTVYGF